MLENHMSKTNGGKYLLVLDVSVCKDRLNCPHPECIKRKNERKIPDTCPKVDQIPERCVLYPIYDSSFDPQTCTKCPKDKSGDPFINVCFFFYRSLWISSCLFLLILE